MVTKGQVRFGGQDSIRLIDCEFVTAELQHWMLHVLPRLDFRQKGGVKHHQMFLFFVAMLLIGLLVGLLIARAN